MRRKVFITFFFSALLAALALPAVFAAGPPTQISYQGTLLDTNGLPVTATQTITFAFYSVATGGTPFWQEAHPVTPDAGVFSVMLGSVTPLDPAAFAGGAAWLGIQPQGSPELAPRQALGSSVYALLAADADTLDGFNAADFYTRSALSTSGGGGQVHWGNLLGTPTNLTQLAALVCASGEVARWDGSTWVCDTTTPAWSALSGVPAGFADGVDDNTIYSAGSGLVLSGTTFSVLTGTVQARVSSACTAGSSIRAIAADGTVTCEPDSTGVSAVWGGTGLLGGALTGTAVISADTTYLQRRVSSTCTAGSSIRTIAADGTVTCEPDDNSGGDITAVTAGTGLSGGALTGTAVITADTTYLQRRVSSTCTAGSSIRAIAADGTVTCETDSTGVSAVWGGTGLLGGGYTNVTLGVDTTYVQRRVSSTCTAGSAIRAIAADGTITCEPIASPVYGCRISGGGAFNPAFGPDYVWENAQLNMVEEDTTASGCWSAATPELLTIDKSGYYTIHAGVNMSSMASITGSPPLGVTLQRKLGTTYGTLATGSTVVGPNSGRNGVSAATDMLYLSSGEQLRIQVVGITANGYAASVSLRYLGQ